VNDPATFPFYTTEKNVDVNYQAGKILDFAVIGAQKCATSWMYYCLKDHPEICVPVKKKEADYISGERFNERGEDWFFERFSRKNELVIGDVSVDYLFHAASAAAPLKSYMPRPRLVVSIRNPIDRFISSYYWLFRKCLIPNQSIGSLLEKLVDELNAPVGAASLVSGEEREIMTRGFYDLQIMEYFKVFEPDQIQVVLYDDIKTNPEQVINRVYGFLGVNEDFRPASLNAKPKQNSYSNWLLRLERWSDRPMVSRIANIAHQVTAKFRSGSAPVPKGIRKKLREIYLPHMEALESALERIPESQRPPIASIKKWTDPV
jgi:hypothetical protein